MNMLSNRIFLATGAVIATALVATALARSEGHAHVWMTETLIGSKVVDDRGSPVGTIEDVVVNPQRDESYAVLSLGKWAEMADRYCAMPWVVIRTVEADPAIEDSVRTLVLTVDKQMLRTAPHFSKRTWPDMTQSDWSREIDAFYVPSAVAARTEAVVEASARTRIVTWRASELKGADVLTTTDEKLGDIEYVAVDTNGRFCYVAVSVGGFLGLGERLAAVPWDALQFSLAGEANERRVIRLASTKEQLGKAPEYSNEEEDRERMCDKDWILGVYEHFSTPPYWDVERTAASPAGSVGK